MTRETYTKTGKVTLWSHNTEGEIEADATFDIVTETYIAEPYSHGGSRGTEAACTAELMHVMFGAHKLSRVAIEEIMGKDWLAATEDRMCDLIMEGL